MWNHGTVWVAGDKAGFDYWVKFYSEGSEYGIENNGCISKLTIRRYGENRDLVNYDRSWDVPVPDDDEIRAVYVILLEKYN